MTSNSSSSSKGKPTNVVSPAFQQVKQTQASLARLTRVHLQQQQQQQQSSQTNSSSSQMSNQTNKEQAQRCTTFVDCLIRRFKDCFSEDFCTVPVFVVGNLSPGSDGTQLILPPCVSLVGQNISRFASPKNLRLMNSIRKSCLSIEELDLGGNKLNDLIEVYKILQCTPNLRFLNLSGNDLSRTSPVAMANTCSAQTTPTPNLPTSWSSISISQQQQRACLAPLNQNSRPFSGTRRHSTLGQTSSRQVAGRVAETRRLAAAAALAQSKKTSSSVASKLADSANLTGTTENTTCSIRGSSGNSTNSTNLVDKSNRLTSNPQRHQAAATSTMKLARSLSSLSAKDVRAASSSLSRLSMLRSSNRKDSNLRVSANRQQSSRLDSDSTSKNQLIERDNKSSNARRELFSAEPIAETDADMEMGDSSNTTAVRASFNQQQVNNQVKALVIQTGNSTTLTKQQTSSIYQSPNLTSNSQQQSANFRRTFESIKALALNDTGCQWRVVCSILSRMPNLEELHLSLNNYERIDLDPNEFKHNNLKRLYLCNNPKLTNWKELDKLLIAFPSLQALSIADCSISQIPDNLDRASEWKKLCGLNINGWPIKEWPIIERLNQLPSLIDLRCRDLELLNSIDEPRHHLIARLPKLQRLNGSEIEEREHAEKAFLRFFMANSHLERPSRFHELVRIHGEVTSVDVDVDLSPPSQAQVRVIYLNRSHYSKGSGSGDDVLMSEDFLIKLMDTAVDSNVVQQNNNLDNMDIANEGGSLSPSSSSPAAIAREVAVKENVNDGNKFVRLFKDDGQEVIALEVDLRQSVRKFKSIIAGLFGLESQNLILYYIDHEMVGLMGPELIKHNQKKLWNYNVQDGDQFIVEER